MKQQDETTVNMTAMLDAVVKESDETATTKTASTPPTLSDSASYSSTLNDSEPDTPHQYGEVILAQLARQLEYYFSKANLEKDTYVETLRQLNDGYVPVSILQRFSKVQNLVPIEAVEAVTKAAAEYSALLEVASIDTKTGKRVEEEVPGSTIVAVGSCSGEPLANTVLQSVGQVPTTPSTPGSPIQNTIIIREVDSGVAEEEVRTLFDDEHCPPVLSLYLDVFNCWFVTIDTTSRDDMLYVMMALRSQYLGDEPVKARLKSLVRTIDPAAAPNLPSLNPVTSYTQLSGLYAPQQLQQETGAKSKKKRKKKRCKNHSNNQGNNNQGSLKKNGNNGANNSNQNSSNNREAGANNKTAAARQQPKPDLSSASFPALTPDAPKVEVVVEGDIEDAPVPKIVAGNLDAASTATTLSSFSVSKGKQALGGYAAALLKAKPANGAARKVKSESSKAADSSSKGKNGSTRETEPKATTHAVTPKATPVVVSPPSWGGGRSFADVLAR